MGNPRIGRSALVATRFGAGRTALTRGFTGRLARGIKNQLLDAMSAPDAHVLPYPLQRHLVRTVSGAAEKAGRPELIAMWSGQSANLTRHRQASAFLAALISEVPAVVDRLRSRA